MRFRDCLLLLLLAFCGNAIAQPVVITPPSATIEPGQSVTLTASGATFYQWSPAAGLSTTIGPVTVASPMVTTTYTCTGYGPGAESVVNGDFEQGNVGFTSAYQYNSNLWGEGTFYVGANAHDYHSGFQGLGHGGTGNFMIVNGAVSPGTNVWTEQINVVPNTYYAFSTWACNVSVGNPDQVALLQFSINGDQLGDIFSAPNELDAWAQFYEIWYSGNATSATITILNQNTAGGGNDFGLDDISFCQLVFLDDEQCTVSLEALEANNDSGETCAGQSVVVPFLDNDQLLQNCNNFGCQIIQQAQHGVASYANNQMTYTPNQGYSGTDQFRYRISCGTQSAEASVNITVYPSATYSFSATACDSYTWHGHTYTHSVDSTWTVSGATPQGCDSIYTLQLTIHHSEEITLPAVTECDSYTWHGTTYTQSGFYDYQTTTQYGCQRVEHLPLTIHYSDTVEFNVSACEEYTWHGTTYTQSGNHTFNTTNQYGCSRLERLFLTISDSYREVEPVTECDSYFWPVTQQWYYATTMDSIVIEGEHGQCDSTFVLDLTLHYADTIDLEPVTACEAYQWYGTTYTESGTYGHPTTNEFGCARLERLQVTINHDSESEFWVTSCEPYEWFGTTYTHPGDYEHHIPNTAGCDSLMVLHLELGDDYVMDETVTACDSYTWHGTTYTAGGDFDIEVENPDGCDSIFKLHLTLGHTTEREFDTLACEPFQWHGQYCDENGGTYQFTIPSALGCDSTMVMHLKLVELQETVETIETCDPYEYGGVVYSEPGEYFLVADTIPSAMGCDSVINVKRLKIMPLEEKVENMGHYSLYVASNYVMGVYTFEIDTAGVIGQVEWSLSNPSWSILEEGQSWCKILVATPGECVLSAKLKEECAMTARQFILKAGFFGIDDQLEQSVSLYPNPTDGHLTIEAEGIESVRLTNMMGQVLGQWQCDRSRQFDLDLSGYEPSVYLLEVKTGLGLAKKRVTVCR